MKKNFDQLTTTRNIGETIAKSIVNFFATENNVRLINKLSSFGDNMSFSAPTNLKKIIFIQKCFCITGSFDIPLNEIKTRLEQKYDATVVNSISNKVDYNCK